MLFPLLSFPLALLGNLSPSVGLGLLELLGESSTLGFVRGPRVLLHLGSVRLVIGNDLGESGLDRESLRVLATVRLCSVNLGRLERLAVPSLLALVVLLDEGDLFLAEGTLEVVHALVNRGELLRETVLVLLELLDLQLDEIVRRHLGNFL